MSEFKTRAEIVGGTGFIQYLEQLKSGSLSLGDGINRVLERLSENENALLEAVQSARWPAQLYDGGLITLTTGGDLSFSDDITIVILSEIHGVFVNKIPAGSVLGIVGGDVLYVVLNRASEAASLTLQKASLATYLATVTGAANRLDYFVVAFASAGGLNFCNGQRLRLDYAFDGNFFTDTQYGQQTELTLVHDNQKENFRLMLAGGGNITWDLDSEQVTFGEALAIRFPSSPGGNQILQGTYSIPAGNVMYVTLVRTPALGFTVSPVVVPSGTVPSTDDVFVVAIHHSDGRLYLGDGTSLSDGETVLLGGARTGVAWFYKEVGTGVQVIDLTKSGTAPGNTYKVGSNELMVYRNGQKARGADTYWNGNYPAGAAANPGALTDWDEYIEVDYNGSGVSDRIAWIKDGQEVAEPLYHLTGTHDPAWTWPGVDDYLEIFVGIQGAAPEALNSADFNPIQGFEVVTCVSATEIYTAGGVVISGGVAYRSLQEASEKVVIRLVDVYGVEVVAADTWRYVYLGQGPTPGAPPVGVHSALPPTTGPGSPYGTHPSDPTLKFLCSVRINALGQFQGFVKEGSRVLMSDPVDVTALVSGTWPTVSWAGLDLLGAGVVPATGVGGVKLQILLVTSGVTNGDGVEVRTRRSVDTLVANEKRAFAIKPGNAPYVAFEIETGLRSNNTLEMLIDSTTYASFNSAKLLGYSEGRFSTSSDLLG